MRSTELLSAEASVLVVVDAQERLVSAMDETVWALVEANIVRLATAARRLDVPILHAEQYPKGLGPTAEAIRGAVEGAVFFEKVTFSCGDASGFDAALKATGRSQAVIVGMEAHVCVLQTALDLLARGFEAFVAADAVCSRFALDYTTALARMRQAGVGVPTTESVIFEWLRRADTDAFKDIRGIFRKQ